MKNMVKINANTTGSFSKIIDAIRHQATVKPSMMSAVICDPEVTSLASNTRGLGRTKVISGNSNEILLTMGLKSALSHVSLRKNLMGHKKSVTSTLLGPGSHVTPPFSSTPVMQMC